MVIAKHYGIFFRAILNKPLIKDLSSIALPLIIANVINNGLQMIDQIMLSSLGTPTLTAVGIVNQFYFLFSIIFLGTASGAGVFFSRLWQQKDIVQIKKIQVLVLYIEVFFSLILLFIAFHYSESIVRLYTKDETIIRIGTIYFQHTVFGQPFFALSCVYIYLLRISNHTKVATVGSIITVFINTFLNYCFIYGNLGAPALGIAGVAISTTVSRLFLLSYFVVQTNRKAQYFKLKLKDFFHLDFTILKKLYKVTFSLVVGEVLVVLSTNIAVGIFVHFSTDVGAAYSITLVMRQIATLTINSIAPAAMIIIGYKIGENILNTQEIKKFCLEIQGLCFYLSLLLICIVLLLEPLILKFGYEQISHTVYYYTFVMIVIMAFFLPIMNANVIFTNSIFRSGGTTHFNLINIIITNIFIKSFGAYFCAIYTKNIILTYCVLFLGDIVRLFFNILYFKFGKWLKAI